MNTQKNLMKSWKIALVILPLLAIATVAGAAFSGSGVVPTGHWVLSDVQGCPEGLVCTEWELANGEIKDIPCCQDPSMVGSPFFHTCNGEGGYFRN